MREVILLNKNPRIEFELLERGFNLIDGQTEANSGFYAYHELKSVDLNNAWFPRVSKWLRVGTWMLNGVPYFPDAESCKKSSIVFHFTQSILGIWLNNTHMADKAKRLKTVLDEKTQ